VKEQNDIDNLFKSKLSNKTFELKDSYLADFEQQLDAYNNTKKRGLLWFVFAGAMAFVLLYDFVVLPQFNTKTVENVPELKTDTNNKHNNSTNITTSAKEDKQTIPTKENTNVLDTIEEPSDYTTKESKNNTITTQSNTLQNNNSAIDANVPNHKKDNTGNTAINNKLQDNGATVPNSEDNAETAPAVINQAPEQSTPDVYIDDTIRRSVVIVDTIVKRDTITVVDTVKRKIRLFKKKR